MANIDTIVTAFMGRRQPGTYEASFDYCFNYFQLFREQAKVDEIDAEENLEMSCLQLGFYLASWGMLRGFMHDKSVKCFTGVVELISQEDATTGVWGIDVPYEPCDIDKLLHFANKVRATLREVRTAEKPDVTDTLVTKIMLGVFGNIPAFDKYFKKAFHLSTDNWDALKNGNSLEEVSKFYDAHADTINEIIGRPNAKTVNFETGLYTNRSYTRAKIIDMVGVTEGKRLEEQNGQEEKGG